MPGVFSPRGIDPGTTLLVEHAEIPDRGLILDMGCGYGAIGITLAKAYPGLTVYMVDINRNAVKLAKLNAKLNGVEDRVVIMHGDLYKPLPRNLFFDAILSNPPLSAGMKTVEKLIREAPEYMKPGATLQLVVWRMHNLVEEAVRDVFGEFKVLASKKGYRVLLARKP